MTPQEIRRLLDSCTETERKVLMGIYYNHEINPQNIENVQYVIGSPYGKNHEYPNLKGVLGDFYPEVSQPSLEWVDGQFEVRGENLEFPELHSVTGKLYYTPDAKFPKLNMDECDCCLVSEDTENQIEPEEEKTEQEDEKEYMDEDDAPMEDDMWEDQLDPGAYGFYAKAKGITVDMILGLFPNVEGMSPTRVKKDGTNRIEYYGNFNYRTEGRIFEISGNVVYVRKYDKDDVLTSQMFVISNSYGEIPAGRWLDYMNGVPYCYHVARAIRSSDDYICSNGIYFNPDGTLNERKILESYTISDFNISIDDLLDSIRKTQEQETSIIKDALSLLDTISSAQRNLVEENRQTREFTYEYANGTATEMRKGKIDSEGIVYLFSPKEKDPVLSIDIKTSTIKKLIQTHCEDKTFTVKR